MSREELESSTSLKSGPRPVGRSQPNSGFSRIIPAFVVFGTVAGFMALAWYAYQTGSQSLKEDDLLVVEADKTPMKEKPTDPGGMQFPNQDKTIFDTFSGSGQAPAKVERVLPTPEEPIAKNADNSETKTWINDKLHKPQDAAKQTEQVIGDDGKKDQNKASELAVDSVPLFAVEPKVEEALTGAKVIRIEEDKSAAAAEKAAKEAEEKAKAEKLAAENAAKDAEEKAKIAREAEEKAKAEKLAAENAAKDAAEKAKAEKVAVEKAQAQAKTVEAQPKAATESKPAAQQGSYNVQLGAYRSEQEAREAWASMQKKYKQMANFSPVIVKADLGEKGVYYRLRTGGFSTAGEAKAFCNSMSILGQACILPTK